MTRTSGRAPTGFLLGRLCGLWIFEQKCRGTIMSLIESIFGSIVVLTELNLNSTRLIVRDSTAPPRGNAYMTV